MDCRAILFSLTISVPLSLIPVSAMSGASSIRTEEMDVESTSEGALTFERFQQILTEGGVTLGAAKVAGTSNRMRNQDFSKAEEDKIKRALASAGVSKETIDEKSPTFFKLLKSNSFNMAFKLLTTVGVVVTSHTVLKKKTNASVNINDDSRRKYLESLETQGKESLNPTK